MITPAIDFYRMWTKGISIPLLCCTGSIIITTLPPIETEGLCKSDVEDLMNRTRAIMLEAFTITSKEVQAAALKKTPSY
jgi:hypothetical protein